MKFTRLILARVYYNLYPEYNTGLVYIMEAHNEKSNLWNKVQIIVTMVQFQLGILSSSPDRYQLADT